MIQRTLKADFLNSVANHPEVRPWLGGKGDVDWQSFLDDTGNVGLVCEDGGFVFCKLADGLYEVHSQFLPGASAIQSLRDALAWMFTHTDAAEIGTRVAADNPAARGLALGVKAKRDFSLVTDPKTGGQVTFFSMTLANWALEDPRCVAEGIAFHDLLKSAGKHDDHPEDGAHDAAVGATILMCKGGQPAKAIWFYNRWAALTGYGQIRAVNADPLIIDIGGSTIALIDGQLEVI